jgi:hypothetical protein
MNERIKALAEQAGFDDVTDYKWECRHDHLERFAELVLQNYVSQIMTTEERERFIREDEREACAKLCEDEYKLRLAETIRARGNT